MSSQSAAGKLTCHKRHDWLSIGLLVYWHDKLNIGVILYIVSVLSVVECVVELQLHRPVHDDRCHFVHSLHR